MFIALFFVAQSIDSDISKFTQTRILVYNTEKEAELGNQYPINERFKFEVIDQGKKLLNLEPDEEKEVTITLKNTGKSSWYLNDDYQDRFTLGTDYRKDLSKFFDGETKILVDDKDEKEIINPDDTTTFNLKITAPEEPGIYKIAATPLIPGKKWLTNTALEWTLIVEGDFSASYNYEIKNKNTLEKAMKPNDTAKIKLEITNTGDATWYNDESFPLTLDPTDLNTVELFGIGTNKIQMREQVVQPGDKATFTFDITSSGEQGAYTIPFVLSIPGLFSLDSNPINLGITVTNKMVALTFDDGYGDVDPFIEVLNENNVRATFFILGAVAENNPEEIKKIVDNGHLLASHGYNHPDFRTLSADEIRWQLSKTRAIYNDIIGFEVYPYFRYPYGAHSEKTDEIVEGEGWKYFQWTNGTGDYKCHENTSAGREQVYYYATLNPPEKAIVLMHVISKSTAAVLPDVINWYKQNGYAFVTVDQL